MKMGIESAWGTPYGTPTGMTHSWGATPKAPPVPAGVQGMLDSAMTLDQVPDGVWTMSISDQTQAAIAGRIVWDGNGIDVEGAFADVVIQWRGAGAIAALRDNLDVVSFRELAFKMASLGHDAEIILDYSKI